MLYKMENVTINENWKQIFNQNEDAYATETDIESNDDDYDNYEEQNEKSAQAVC
jgi:hypothetical protein